MAPAIISGCPRLGDRIRFQFEDRPGGRRVITALR
jgi:hypothetical protein